ncbi:hypothetical protein [Polaromonas sp. AER18D-145]|uniref:hypothetical protein n=1 Tax=Polaromonas sp. AER18D-145 TaxID=1977060 RepID=UPI000BBC5152|nr:hypothetical protein [Polaromonas sp. AER18D-145]
MSEFKLTTEIVALSSARVWDAAKLEWVLHEVFESDEPDTCLCGHYPIIENCVLRNKVNGNLATVGNCCVKKFIGLPSDLIFQAVKRIRADTTKSLNGEAINYACERGWVTAWESDFYFDIMRKRSLTAKQSSKKRQINEKFLFNMRAARSAH